MKKPLILVTNDDGVDAPGLKSLIKSLNKIGKLVVVSPEEPQSGMGHAITMKTPIRYKKLHASPEIDIYSCNGTPVDCVKISADKIITEKPDLLLSGINHGVNSSINVIYSGTMAAAIEGAMLNIPSAGFSLCDYSADADFSATGKYVRVIAENIIKYGLPDGVCLNVNIPAVKSREIKGMKICRQANGYWDEGYEEEIGPAKKKYYWIRGTFIYTDKGKDTDVWALSNNYVSVVPIQLDLTSYNTLEKLKKWKIHV